MSEVVSEVSDSSFPTEVLESTQPVLVDFWAPWCGPCKALAPHLHSVASEYNERLKVVKVNVDDNPEMAKKYGVRGIPTLLIFKEGEVADTKVGASDEANLKTFIESNI